MLEITAMSYNDGSTVLRMFKSETEFVTFRVTPLQLLHIKQVINRALDVQLNATPDDDKRIRVYTEGPASLPPVYPAAGIHV